jgi:transposase
VKHDGPSPEERFQAAIEMSDTGCWLWKKALNSTGVPVFAPRQRPVSAARWAYAQRFGLPPQKQHLRHECGERRCVNPDHLKLPTDQAAQPHEQLRTCRHGHLLSPDNIYWHTTTHRARCRECHRKYKQASYQKRRTSLKPYTPAQRPRKRPHPPGKPSLHDRMLLTISDALWRLAEGYFRAHSLEGGSRKRTRATLAAILFILRERLAWNLLPLDFGVSPTTVCRKFLRWQDAGLLRFLQLYAAEFPELHDVDWDRQD